MQKTRGLMDENSVSFQMFLVLCLLLHLVQKANFCVQAMPKQYSDVWGFFGGGGGGSMRRSQNLEIFFSEKKRHKALRSVQFLASFIAFISKYYLILHVMKR